MLGIIGGTGLAELPGVEPVQSHQLDTPFGATSAPIIEAKWRGVTVAFLARHGNPHRIPPHKVNYRANIKAFEMLGIKEILAVTAVGGIRSDLGPARLCIPDQIIDYTYGRDATFFEDNLDDVVHVDFSYPYTQSLREELITAAQQLKITAPHKAVYGATQGPRLETAAEIKRLANDGCSIVGMTGMPEACLARELNIDYANLSVVANWAAGITDDVITMTEIYQHLEVGMAHVSEILALILTQRAQ